jgi:predicted transcriptional regulator
MHVITIRLPDDLAAALKEHKQRTDVPTEAFVRRAIREQLFKQVIVEAEPEVKQSPKVLI